MFKEKRVKAPTFHAQHLWVLQFDQVFHGIWELPLCIHHQMLDVVVATSKPVMGQVGAPNHAVEQGRQQTGGFCGQNFHKVAVPLKPGILKHSKAPSKSKKIPFK